MPSSSSDTPWDEAFWTQRYQTAQIGWDMGQVSPPLKAYIDQLEDPKTRILIPGAGNAYEAEYLHQQGFEQVTVIDLSAEPLQDLQERCPNFPRKNLIQGDFFDLVGEFDVILEQTFFCALAPALRSKYVHKMKSLLAQGGHLAGLLFDIPLNTDHPPFGGNREAYRELFQEHFHFHAWDTAHNSIPPRAGNELWINLIKKD